MIKVGDFVRLKDLSDSTERKLDEYGVNGDVIDELMSGGNMEVLNANMYDAELDYDAGWVPMDMLELVTTNTDIDVVISESEVY